MLPVALIVTDYVRQPVDNLPPLDGRLEVVARKSHEVDAEIWHRTEILYTFTTLPQPEQAPNLKWVQLFSAGADHALRHPIASAPVVFTSVSGVHAIPIAEYVLGVLLGWTHKIPKLIGWQDTREWPAEAERMTRFVPRKELWGTSLGILGYGSVGRQIARAAKGFGMRILATRRSSGPEDRGYSLPGVGDPKGELPEKYYRPDQLHDLLGESEVVVVILPLTPETRNMIDESAIRSMPKGAILIDVSRGGVVNEDALIEAMRSEHLSAAFLDVFSSEPLVPENPLWTLPNVFMSPHISGHSTQYASRANMVFVENMQRYLSGNELLNIISRELHY